MKKTVSLITIIIALLFYSCDESQKKGELSSPQKPQPKLVEVTTTHQSTIYDTIRENGLTAPIQEVMITAKRAGTITSIKTAFGQRVKKQTLLLTVENEVERARVNQAKVALQQAQLNFDVMKKLFDKKSVAKSEYLGAKSSLQTAKTNLITQRFHYNNSFHYAPFAGSITMFDPTVVKGATITTGTPFAQLIDISKLTITLHISENKISHIQKGNRASLYLNALEKEVVGEVTAISEGSDPATASYAVEITIDNPDKEIKAGMSCRVAIASNRSQIGVIINSSAITQKGKQKGVFMVDNGAVFFQPVTTKELWGDQQLVIEGLPERATIVTTGVSLLTDGEQITISEVTRL